jgi:hypothetical protein
VNKDVLKCSKPDLFAIAFCRFENFRAMGMYLQVSTTIWGYAMRVILSFHKEWPPV